MRRGALRVTRDMSGDYGRVSCVVLCTTDIKDIEICSVCTHIHTRLNARGSNSTRYYTIALQYDRLYNAALGRHSNLY